MHFILMTTVELPSPHFDLV